MKKETLTFTREQYNLIVRSAPKILVGRRGNSSKKSRIRKKLVQEVIIDIVDNIDVDLLKRKVDETIA